MANLITTVTATQGRKRKCPQCGHQQAVSSFLATQSVTCRRCAATIPPPDAKAPKGAAKTKGKAKGKGP